MRKCQAGCQYLLAEYVTFLELFSLHFSTNLYKDSLTLTQAFFDSSKEFQVSPFDMLIRSSEFPYSLLP